MDVPKRHVDRNHHWSREYALQYAKTYYQQHREQQLQQRRDNYRRYKAHYVARATAYKRTHPEREREWASNYRKTVRGHLTRIYDAMCRRVQVQPSCIGRPIDFDKQWFFNFALQSDYIKYHIDWALSGYIRAMAPSLDRIDNSKGYLKTNIQFLTQSQNARKHTT